MRYIRVTLPLLMVMFIAGCATTSGPEMTPLEIQAMQSRSYEEAKTIVFPSVVSVFQDLGYTIQSADLATGLITSESAASSDGWHRFWTGTTRVEQTRATAFIEEIGGQSNVRLNFVVVDERSGGWGQRDRRDTPILEADAYQNAFERIENAIFIRSSN
jgi:uncharacterized lipoprotein